MMSSFTAGKEGPENIAHHVNDAIYLVKKRGFRVRWMTWRAISTNVPSALDDLAGSIRQQEGEHEEGDIARRRKRRWRRWRRFNVGRVLVLNERDRRFRVYKVAPGFRPVPRAWSQLPPYRGQRRALLHHEILEVAVLAQLRDDAQHAVLPLDEVTQVDIESKV